MKRLISGLALAGLWIAAPAATGEEAAWVRDTGALHAVHAGSAVFVAEEDAERFDLSRLEDGETRTFGQGPRAVTARRDGDTATLSRAASADHDVSAIDITCRLADDTCTVLTFPDDPEKVMVAIEKERICENGVGDCDFSLDEHVAGGSKIIVDIECDGSDEDCEDLHALRLEGLGELHNVIEVDTEGDGDDGQARIVIRRIGAGDGGDEKVFVTSAGSAGAGLIHGLRSLHGDRVLLRCSEGDATLEVTKEEAGDTFLCPKHSTPMEKVKRRGHGVHVIREHD